MTAETAERAMGRKEMSDTVWGWWLVLILAAVLLVLLGIAYIYLGWLRMDAVCSTDAAVPPGVIGASVDTSWSWMPFGFTCTWGDVSVTKLWW